MDFRGAAKKLDDIDLPKWGQTIGVGEDELHAFLDVESRGTGFDSLGRPKILFEPHKFYKNLPASKRAEAVRQGLAAPKWGTIPYGKESDQYEKLKKAIEIDETAALKSCSWGLTQVLGENHAMIGYPTVQDMVEAFKEDEENHLKACIDFLVAAKIDDDLKAHRWAKVAEVYNGPGYKKNNYDTKMAKAFAKWQEIKDTPYYPDQPEEPEITQDNKPQCPPILWDNDRVKELQELLRSKGYFEVGKVDGLWGEKTIAAIAAFQASQGLPVNVGLEVGVDECTLQRLAIAPKRSVSPQRASTTKRDLIAQGSSTVINAEAVNWASMLQIGMAVVESIVIAYNTWQQTPLPFGSELLLQMAGTPAWLLPIGQFLFALYSIIKANKVIMARIQSERSGMHNGEPDPAPSPPVEESPEPHQGVGNVRRAA